MSAGQLVAAGSMRLASLHPVSLRLAWPRLRVPSVPPKLTSAAMGLAVGGLYALALGHPALWISIGIAASLWLGKAGRDGARCV